MKSGKFQQEDLGSGERRQPTAAVKRTLHARGTRPIGRHRKPPVTNLPINARKESDSRIGPSSSAPGRPAAASPQVEYRIGDRWLFIRDFPQIHFETISRSHERDPLTPRTGKTKAKPERAQNAGTVAQDAIRYGSGW